LYYLNVTFLNINKAFPFRKKKIPFDNLFAAASFAVDCGGSRTIFGSDSSVYQADNASLGAASYYVAGAPTWGVSSVGRFMDPPNGSYIIYSSRQFQNTLDSALFQTARMSPSSLRYYGIGLENGNYTVTLQFAEVDFPDIQSWRSRGRRIFDIYVQVATNLYTGIGALRSYAVLCSRPFSFPLHRVIARSRTLT
jgi:hypothetical protein